MARVRITVKFQHGSFLTGESLSVAEVNGEFWVWVLFDCGRFGIARLDDVDIIPKAPQTLARSKV